MDAAMERSFAVPQDLVREVMAAEDAEHAGLAALAVWLRLAAMRKLTWNREALRPTHTFSHSKAWCRFCTAGLSSAYRTSR